MSKVGALPDSAFLVLALLAERETHGYEIQKLVHNRGFRFWTKLERSSIYNALAALEKAHLIRAHIRAGEGPDRKVYRITENGLVHLHHEGLRHLSMPAHPRSEIDLGIYVLPLLPRRDAKAAIAKCLKGLHARKEFLEERLAWCRARRLWGPALAFERPLLALEAEIQWLARVASEMEHRQLQTDEWNQYAYQDPPGRLEVDGGTRSKGGKRS